MGNCNNLIHAQHNEEACNYLIENGNFNDWVVTTAFYSCLHFVRHQLIPFRKVVDGKNVSSDNFEKLYKLICKPKESKHFFLKRMVEEYHEDIAYEYSMLLDLANGVRYTNFNIDNEKTCMAVNSLQHIKAHCSK